MQHPLLQGVFGSINGLNLPCQVSSDVEMENATYNRWLHSHFISSVIVFSSKGSCPCSLECVSGGYSWFKQEKSLAAAQIVLEAGTIHVLPREFMTNWNMKHQMATALSLTLHSLQVTIALPGRYTSHLKPE